MSAGTIDSDMKSRFEAAEKTYMGESELRQPALRPTEQALEAHFRSEVGLAAEPLENPHVEPRVTDADRREAVPASVLLAIVLRESEPTLLVTKRHAGISYPGHWVFPGSRADSSDATPIDTALREAEEEIGLDRNRFRVLGRLGEYVSHSGFRITPVVALVEPPVDDLKAHPGEVDAIAEVELSRILDSSNYFLFRFKDRRDRAHFALDTMTSCESEKILLTGLTVSICIGLYSELLKTHSFLSG